MGYWSCNKLADLEACVRCDDTGEQAFYVYTCHASAVLCVYIHNNTIGTHFSELRPSLLQKRIIGNP